MNLEMTNEKLEAELEVTKQQLRAALSGPVTERGDSKTSKASVVTRSATCFYAFAITLCVSFRNNWKEIGYSSHLVGSDGALIRSVIPAGRTWSSGEFPICSILCSDLYLQCSCIGNRMFRNVEIMQQATRNGCLAHLNKTVG